jgi:hypothetical protein
VTGREEHENRAAAGEDQPVKDSLRGRGRVFTVEASGPAGSVSMMIPVRAAVQADAILRAGMVLAARMLSGEGDCTPGQWTVTGFHARQDSGDPETERAPAESPPSVTGTAGPGGCRVDECGDCGTALLMLPQAPASGPGPEQSVPAAWECVTWLRHTGRRCERARVRKRGGLPAW